MTKSSKILLILFVFITLVGSILVNKEFLLKKYADFFIINNASKGADLILILSGNILSRGPHAYHLLNQSYADRIMITKRKWHKLPYGLKYPSDIELALEIKKKFKIKTELEILPNQSGQGALSTFDEAYDLLFFLKSENVKKIILVTDEHHSKRALLAFNKIISDKINVQFQVSTPENQLYTKDNWWKSDLGLKAYILEIFLYIYYLINDGNSKKITNY